MLSIFLDDLVAAGYSRSAGRIAVFEYLLTHGSASPAQLKTALADFLDRASLYRTLALFRDLGVIDEHGYGSHRRIELSDRYAPHHHHLRCRICGRVDNLNEIELENVLSDLANNHGFTLETHVVELSGVCETCQ